MSIEKKLKESGITIPKAPEPAGAYVPAVVIGDLVFASGQTPTVNGELQYVGKVGKEVSVEDAYKGARLSMLNCLAEINAALGSLDKVDRIVKVNGYVASAPGFGEQPKVVNGASDLLLEVFGEKGKHARAAVGVAELPFNAPVEVEVICSIKNEG